jgi:effector-binding domain-containing protein
MRSKIRPGLSWFTAAILVMTAGWSQAAAPVFSPPKQGLSGNTAGTQTPALPVPVLPGTTLPASGNSPSKAEPKITDGHDHEVKPGTSVIEAVDLPVLPALVRTTRATWDNGYGTIRATIAALRAEASRAKLEPKGRPLIVYIESNDKDFRVDVLLPLASEPADTATLSAGFRTGHNPGGKALKFEHRSAYADVETTYEAITAYLDTKDLSAREFFIEEFVNDVPDPGDIKMAVNIYVFLK